jgi:hypothetical protein
MQFACVPGIIHTHVSHGGDDILLLNLAEINGKLQGIEKYLQDIC